jgi:hypothetical protein
MKELIQLFAQIALLRRGPQDLPASGLLLALTLLGYLGITFAVCSVLPPMPGWPAQVLVTALFTLLWYGVLLRACKRAERLLQTATAVFGLQTLLAPLLSASDWLVLRVDENSPWQVPVELGALVLAVWLIAASSHIVRAALEWSSPASVALVILQIFATRLLLLTLFPPVRA